MVVNIIVEPQCLEISIYRIFFSVLIIHSDIFNYLGNYKFRYVEFFFLVLQDFELPKFHCINL